jgi:excisionase family DNA binding protein
MQEKETLMTTKEVAEFLSVPVGTVYAWRAAKKGPRGHRVGRGIRYRRADVLAWLDRRADPEVRP